MATKTCSTDTKLIYFYSAVQFLFFTTCLESSVTAIDLGVITSMNNASTTFYAGMNERIKGLVSATHRVRDHAEDARRFSTNIAELLRRARRLEALVDRLDEYTSRQEAALSKK